MTYVSRTFESVVTWENLHRGIVDDDVELEFARLWVLEVVLGDLYEVLGAVFRAHARLYADGLDTILGLDLGGEVLSGFG